MSLESSIHTSAPSISLEIHWVRALSPLFYPMTTAAPSISLDLDTNTPELYDSCSCEYILPDIIGQLDSCVEDKVLDWKGNFEKCFVHWTLYFHHCWTHFNRLICAHWRLKTKKENPTYLLPWALRSHVTAGNSKEEHHKPRKERTTEMRDERKRQQRRKWVKRVFLRKLYFIQGPEHYQKTGWKGKSNEQILSWRCQHDGVSLEKAQGYHYTRTQSKKNVKNKFCFLLCLTQSTEWSRTARQSTIWIAMVRLL